MSIHYCMSSPCPVCNRSTISYGSVTQINSTMTSTSTYPSSQRFFTWREAILTALHTSSTQKPTVRRESDGRWCTTTYPALYAINTAS